MKQIFFKAMLVTSLIFSSAIAFGSITIKPPRVDADDSGKINDLRSKIGATFYADFDLSRKLINLTESNPASRSLTVGESEAGYRVIDHFEIGVGIGPTLSFWFNNGTGLRSDLQASIGLLPTVGKSLTAIRFAPSRADAKNLKRYLTPPMFARDLADWNVGDSVEFSSDGGVAFGATLTQGIAVVSLVVSTSGDFTTYVERIDNNTYLVDVSATKLKSAIGSAGASFAALSLSHAKSLTRGLSFMVDVSQDDGAKAYEDLVRGNILAVQERIKNGKLNSVRPWEKYRIPQVAQYRSFAIKIPIVFKLSWSKGKIWKVNDTAHLYDGSSIRTHFGVYVKDSELRVLTKKKTHASGFYGVAFTAKNADGTSMHGKFGQYVWTYISNKSDSDGLREAMDKAIRNTGLRDVLRLNVAEGAKGANQILLAIDITDEQTDSLMMLSTKATEAQFVRAAMELQNEYFKSGDVDGLCRHYVEELETCISELSAETQSGAERMFKYVKLMASAWAVGDHAAFTDAYANFGRGMIRNQFTFQAALLMAGGDAQMVYSIQGSNVARYNASYGILVRK